MNFLLPTIFSLVLASLAPAQTLEQRLAALEHRVTAVEEIVTPVPATKPALAVAEVRALSAWHAIHLRVDEATIDSLARVQWVSDKGVERRGFNAAFLREDGDVFVCSVNGTPVAAYRVTWPAALAPTPLPTGADIATLKAGTYSLAAGEYVASGPASFQDVTLLGAGKGATIVRYTGNPKQGWPWASGTRTVWRGLTIVSPYVYKPVAKRGEDNAGREAVSFINPGDDSAFIDVEAVGWNYAWNLNNHPSRVLIRECVGRNMIAYLVWNEGQDVAVYDCTADDAILEHIVRGKDFARWALNGNRFANVADPANVNNDAKGTIVCQAGDAVYRWDNSLRGPTGLGPLPINAGGADKPLTRAVVEDDNASEGLELWGGLKGFRVTGTKLATWYSRDGRIVENGTVPVGSAVPAWAKSIGFDN